MKLSQFGTPHIDYSTCPKKSVELMIADLIGQHSIRVASLVGKIISMSLALGSGQVYDQGAVCNDSVQVCMV